jgi:exo-beta-1,3-glucanase (GH17 family)
LWNFIVAESRKRNIELLIILDYGNPFYNSGHRPLSDGDIAAYVRYAKFIVSHFSDKVHYFEIWNEWDQNNGNSGIGTPSEYMAVVKATYPALKAIAPQATILVGGTSRYGMTSFAGNTGWDSEKYHFLERLIAMGLMQYGDGLSIHPYCRTESSVAEKLAAYRTLLSNVVAAARARNQGNSYPIYVTEVGWPSTRVLIDGAVSLSDQAALVGATIDATRQIADVKLLAFFQLRDSGRDPTILSANYGLFNSRNRAKEAAAVFRARATQ